MNLQWIRWYFAMYSWWNIHITKSAYEKFVGINFYHYFCFIFCFYWKAVVSCYTEAYPSVPPRFPDLFLTCFKISITNLMYTVGCTAQRVCVTGIASVYLAAKIRYFVHSWPHKSARILQIWYIGTRLNVSRYVFRFSQKVIIFRIWKDFYAFQFSVVEILRIFCFMLWNIRSKIPEYALCFMVQIECRLLDISRYDLPESVGCDLRQDQIWIQPIYFHERRHNSNMGWDIILNLVYICNIFSIWHDKASWRFIGIFMSKFG